MKNSLLFFILFTPLALFAQFSDGNGTESSPYIITTAAQLAQLATYVNAGDTDYNNKYYKLGNNIDLSAYGSTFNNGKGWIPIGSYINTSDYEAFLGSFDGDHYKITHLYINASNESFKGLFGYAHFGTVKNLGIEGVNINGYTSIGSIVGGLWGTTIDNCYATGTVSGDAGIGGLVGTLQYGGKIFNSYSTTTVTGRRTIGGLAGSLNHNCKINKCYATGNVSASNASGDEEYFGGLVGYMVDNDNGGCEITNCYTTGNVNGNACVGGILGGTSASSGNINTKVENCYAIGTVTGNDWCVGGLVGSLYSVGSGYHRVGNSAALNPKVSYSYSDYVGRVVGRMGSVFNNIAFNGMLNYNNNTNWTPVGVNTKNGANITKVEIYADGTLGGRFTSSNGWTTQNGKLPGLFGSTVDMPTHLAIIPPVITTNTLPNGTVGTAYSQTLAAIGDTPINWSLITGNLPTGLTLSAAGVISGTPSEVGTFNFTVQAANVAGNNTKALSITVNGVPPVITTTTLPDGIVETSYNQTLTATGTTPINWSLIGGSLPTGLSISITGVISGTPSETGTYNFTVQATNVAGNNTKALTIIVFAPPAITTTTLPDGVVGTVYNQSLTATGTTPITWTLESGSLPTGLTLSTAGVISGTPTVANTFNFTVKATNAVGSNTKALSIIVLAPPVITTTTLPSGITGAAYNQQLTATGSTPVTWSLESGSLPIGLTLSSAGVISGTPIITGISNFTVKATNSVGSDTKSLSIAITSSAVVPTITTTTLPDGKIETAYSVQLEATGSAPITWTLESGSLPTGVTLSTAGVISGTPTEASMFNFTVQATNSAGSDTKALTVKIEDGVKVSENEMGKIRVYPNPTTGELRIENLELKIEKITIFDVYGRNVLTSSETTLNISHLSAGIYFVKINIEKGEVVRKVVKE